MDNNTLRPARGSDEEERAKALLAKLHPAACPASPGTMLATVQSVHPRSAAPVQDIYYDNGAMCYYLRNRSGRFVKLPEGQIVKHLIAGGLSPVRPKGQPMSLVELAVLDIHDNHDVDYVGALAGYQKGLLTFGDTRCLITKEPTFIEGAPGDCSLILGIWEQLFGPVQLPYVLSWIVVSMEMFRSRNWRPGQALFMAGPKGAGKNLFTELLRLLFGGRMVGKPYRYMTGRTDFNSDFFGCELLAIEDEAESTSFQARRAFGAHIKQITANAPQSMHPKGKPALTVVPLWRLVASLNDEPERLLVVPPLDGDIDDKIMLFLVEKHPMPMPTGTAAEYQAFMAALTAQLPALVHYLAQWELPADLRDSRFGVRAYHHPDLVAALQDMSPEKKLLELIDDFIFAPVFRVEPWEGRAVELERQLKEHSNARCVREASNLLVSTTSCGKYLARLVKIATGRVRSRILDGLTVWIIEAPAYASASKPAPAGSPAAKLLERIKGGSASRPNSEGGAAGSSA